MRMRRVDSSGVTARLWLSVGNSAGAGERLSLRICSCFDGIILRSSKFQSFLKSRVRVCSNFNFFPETLTLVPHFTREFAMLVVARRAAACTAARSSSSCRHRHWLGAGALAARESFSSFTTVTEDGSISYLRNPRNGAQVYLVGTAHVSARSADQVREVIDRVKPDRVAVELCQERAKTLLTENPVRKGKTPFQQMQDLFNLPGGLGQKLIGFWLKSMYELIRNTGVEPGKEFRVAMEEAQRLSAEILYIDRNVHETVKRLRDVITVWDVLKMLKNPNQHLDTYPSFMKEMENHDFETAVERLKTRETVREMMNWMEQSFPDVVKVMVHERDQLMVKRLLECEGTVVGVVGMAHMDGIERLWKEAEH